MMGASSAATNREMETVYAYTFDAVTRASASALSSGAACPASRNAGAAMAMK